jgi:FKBP-type peptidyl-prolyl cis-trans isomerase FklB
MKQLTLSVSLLFISVFSIAQTKKAPVAPAKAATTATKAVTPAKVVQKYTELDTVAYAIGMNVGVNLKQQALTDLNMDLVAKGLQDASKGKTSMINEAQANQILSAFFTKRQQEQQMEEAKAFMPNKIAGEKYLAENKGKKGVITLPSGLQYEIMKEGTGPKPTASDKVKTHYHGTLIDGSVFDSSVQRGQPAEFPVGGVIQGWVEALQLMPVGSKWKLHVPYNLAYGERAAGPSIKPFSALVFEVELLEIVK